MNNTDNLINLLHDYIDIFRGIQREQTNAIISYLNSQREMNSALNDLIIRYLEVERTARNLNRNTIRNPFSARTTIPPPPPLFSFGPNNTRGPSQSPINNTPFNFNWPSNTTMQSTDRTSNTRNTTPSTRNTPSLFPRNRSRRTDRTRPRTRIRATTNVTTTAIPRDVFQNFINNTLNMGNIPQPLNAADISANITNLTYGEIAETTNQTICPFTQENFTNSDEISRINPCGHIFTRTHLNRYLTNFDYRCPVCRRNLRREIDVENPPINNNLLDLSSNLTILPTSQNNQQTRNIINNAVESVTNALMSNITNQITNDPSRNAFVAEYSFLLPQLNNTSNLTPNITTTSSADADIHDYLGLPPRNNATQTTLPPLPEDNEEIPDLSENFSDDDEL
tara:strand:+ start:3548 stop:4732 length:1185 start_codon:yes stop_codon:yes gene_type:complete